MHGISVVICSITPSPTPAHLDVVRRILAQARVGDEVVIVAPERWQAVESIPAEGITRTILVDHSLCGLSRARNDGLAVVARPLVAFCDDDGIPADGWLDAIRSGLVKEGFDAVSGRTLSPRSGETMFFGGRVDRCGWLISADTPRKNGQLLNLHGCNMAFRTKAINSIGGFDSRIGYYFDETDVAIRMQRAGRKIGHLSGMVVFHEGARGRPFDPGRWREQVSNISYVVTKNFGIHSLGCLPLRIGYEFLSGLRRSRRWPPASGDRPAPILMLGAAVVATLASMIAGLRARKGTG